MIKALNQFCLKFFNVACLLIDQRSDYNHPSMPNEFILRNTHGTADGLSFAFA